MINILKITDDLNLKITPYNNGKLKYSFITKEGLSQKEFIGVQPLELTNRSQIIEYIKIVKNWINMYLPKIINEKVITELIPELHTEYLSTLKEIETNKVKEKRNQEKGLRDRVKDGEESYNKIDEPLIYIASVIDWFTAGERANIMLSFITYCSQIINRMPINLIPLGEAGSGKTHVQLNALKLIPEEFIIYEKSITAAAFFRRAEEDPYFYDGKIVNYGDMGGDNDQEFMNESKNLMKELQTEGYLQKPLLVPYGGDYQLKDLELIGKPCLTYTTIPNYIFDEQELSRSLIITPRIDNDKIFYERERLLGLHGKTKEYLTKMLNLTEQIQNIVYYLRKVKESTVIVNPYTEFIEKILSNTKYGKRDFQKYDSLLKVVAMFDYKYKTLEPFDDRNFLYVTANDVCLFLSLIKDYVNNNDKNLSPHASKILSELYELSLPLNTDETTGFTTLDSQVGWTVNEYRKKSTIGISKKSCQLYFKELNDKGFVEVIGKNGNSYLYGLTDDIHLTKVKFEDISLSDKMEEKIINELGEDVLNIIKSETQRPGLNIDMQHFLIKKPDWELID